MVQGCVFRFAAQGPSARQSFTPECCAPQQSGAGQEQAQGQADESRLKELGVEIGHVVDAIAKVGQSQSLQDRLKPLEREEGRLGSR